MKPTDGDVLYLALEDNHRRLQRRMAKLLPHNECWPERLSLHTEWRRVDDGGLADIEEWCGSVAAPTLIVVDTLEKLRPQANSKAQAYSADYHAIEGLQKIAGTKGISIAVCHHVRKMDAEDPFDTVSGTLGLTGAADTLLILKRHSGNVTLFAKGRDIEESETAVQFNKNTCRWSILGEAAEVHRSAERQKILAALDDAEGADLSVPEIMVAIESNNRNATDILLHKRLARLFVSGGAFMPWHRSPERLDRKKETPLKVLKRLRKMAIFPIFPIFPGRSNLSSTERIARCRTCLRFSAAIRPPSARPATVWTTSDEPTGSHSPRFMAAPHGCRACRRLLRRADR
jgi:hypothetical protein